MRLLIITLLGLTICASLTVAQMLEPFELDSDFPTTPMLRTHSARGLPAPGKKGVMLMNRIGPSTSTLYIASADGSNERQLLNNSRYKYHASFFLDKK